MPVYTEYWGLLKKPFENAPDPDFLFYSDEHRQALYRLNYVLQEKKGGALLTGEYGCGKTTLVRAAVRNLPPEEYQLAVINNPRLNAQELLAEFLYQLGEKPVDASRSVLSRRLGDMFVHNAGQNRHTVLVIDEAQLISDQTAMEELRLLLNYQTEDEFLLSMVLVGQPELREAVMALPQFEQRLPVRYHLHSFDLENTTNYIHHRMRVGGASKAIFTNEAIHLIFKATHGVPRRINNVCDLCLLEGQMQKVKKITPNVAKTVS